MALWCTDPVHEDLRTGNPVLRVLEHYCGVDRQHIPLDGTSFRMPRVAGHRILGAAALQQGGALLAAPRGVGGRRQRRRHHH